jgi:hypothetical protein
LEWFLKKATMKKTVMAALVGLMAAFAGPVSAVTINSGSTDVGVLDTVLAETTLLSGDAAELKWARSVLGQDIDFVIKHDNLSISDWRATNQSGTWTYNLPDTPEYFLVKTGKNGVNSFVEYLFANNDSKSWAVLDLDDI